MIYIEQFNSRYCEQTLLLKKRSKQKNEAIRVSREEFLNVKPLRNPILEWRIDEKGRTIITLPLKQERKKSFLSRFFNTPPEKKFMTDEIGSCIWKLCDGKHTTKQIIEALHQEFKLNIEETETGLQVYLTKLSKKGLVGFILSDEMKAKFEES